MTSPPDDPQDILSGFGANERAILERVPTRTLRRVAAANMRLKVRLQFTGWLQYLIPMVPTALLGLLAGLLWLVRLPRAAASFGLIAGAVVLVALFDIVAVKLKLAPGEARPASHEALDVFELMRIRHSCRSFQTRTMDDADREALLASVARHTAAPTLGPTPVRLDYIQAPLTVWPTVNASEFLVAIMPKAYDRCSVIDVGRTLQKVVLDATRLGLATCWIGPGADHESIKRQLGARFDPERDHIIVTCAVGYPSRFKPLFIRLFNRQVSYRRRPLSELFFADPALSVPTNLDSPPWSRFGRTFEACQWAPSSYNGQTTRAVLRANDDAVVGVDFYAATASRYYAPVALGIWCAHWEQGCEALGIEGHFEPRPAPTAAIPVPRHDVTWIPAQQVS